MMQRINWIDWAKAIAVCSVVFCHLPQSQEWFYYRYMQATTITVFFFISGYLKKDHGCQQANWKRYWSGLIAPYLLYNTIVYPYWFVRFYMQHGGMPDLFTAIKPIIGTILLEHENSFAEPLNGSLWYLPAILIMHLIIDCCRKTHYLHLIMVGLCILSYFLYAANKEYEFLPNLTPMGLFRRLPYYYIGYLMGQQKLFMSIKPSREIMLLFLCVTISLLLFQWHLQENRILLHATLFYPVNIGLLVALLCFCKLLDRLHWSFITNLSIGTLVIIGLHAIPIGVINFVIEHQRGLSNCPGYQWNEALLITAIIVALLYPIILWSKNYAPVLIGKDHSSRYGTDQAK